MCCLRENQRIPKKKTKLILKSQQTFESKKHKVFTKEVNKIALSTNDDTGIKSIDSTETYAYETTKDLPCKIQIKCNNIIKQYKND